MSAPAASWVTVAHHSSPVLGAAIHSLRREAEAAGLAIEVVVVDHSESASENRRLQDLAADRLIAAPNRGYAAGLNTGFAAAGADLLLAGNPDIEWQAGALPALLRALDSFDVVGPQFVLGAFLFPPADEQTLLAELRRIGASRSEGARVRLLRREVERWRRVWNATTPIEVRALSGAMIAFRRRVLELVGPWDESFFLFFEETDWLRRARRLGMRLAVVPEARVAHQWGHAADARQPGIAAYFAASRARYYRRHYGPLGAWIVSRAGGAPPAWPPLAAPEELPAEPALWLASPSPRGLPAAGATIGGTQLAPALEELATRSPALESLTVTRWSAPAGSWRESSSYSYRAGGVRQRGSERAAWVIRPAEHGDEPALGRLFQNSFGHPAASSYWSWKYRQYPGRARSMVAVRADGEILAHAGALAYPARSCGRDTEIWTLVDFMGTAAGGGLRPPLVSAGKKLLGDLPGPGDAPWIFGFPSRRHFRLGERSFGYQPLRELETLEGELPDAVANATPLCAASDRALPSAEAIWVAAGVDGVRRSVPFLDWRYWARPGRYYRFYAFGEGGAEGFAVFAFHGELALAAEWWLAPAADVRGALLAVAADLRRAGLRRWSFWSSGAEIDASHLAALGLRRTDSPVFVGIRAGSAGDVRELAMKFSYRMGDYDLI